jgi:hypothetical protein
VALGVLDRQLRLDDLALEVPRRVLDAEVADELLGDRRTALDRLARLQVLQRRAGDGLGVDAAVLEEALVLDRDGGLLDALRDAVDRDRRARFVGLDEAELAAVGGVEVVLPPFSIGLQLASDGASAATSSTQEATPIAPSRSGRERRRR